MEYSDEATPLYKDIQNMSESGRVVYTGGLNYYRDVGNNCLISVDGVLVEKAVCTSSLEEARRETLNSYGYAGTVEINGTNYPITDPATWAANLYGGSFTATEWKNPFESSCRFRTTADFKTIGNITYYNHCGPTAITNLIEIVGRYRGYTPITSISNVGTGIFVPVARYGVNAGYYINSSDFVGGSPWGTAADFAKGAFDLFDISVSTLTQTATYSNVKAAIDAYKPVLLELKNDSYYKDHFVAAYAYTKFSNTSGVTIGFAKIADGRVGAGRYIDFDTARLRNMHSITVGQLG